MTKKTTKKACVLLAQFSCFLSTIMIKVKNLKYTNKTTATTCRPYLVASFKVLLST